MKKILLLLLVITHTNTFSQEGNKEINTKFHRFGMNLITMGYGRGVSMSMLPLSIYLANDLNQIISFGLHGAVTPEGFGQLGGTVGYGKMYTSKSNKKLSLGYLMEVSAGGVLYFYNYSSYKGLPFYVGFSPNFILEINQFVFKAGFYVDTSLIVTANVGIGFLLK